MSSEDFDSTPWEDKEKEENQDCFIEHSSFMSLMSIEGFRYIVPMDNILYFKESNKKLIIKISNGETIELEKTIKDIFGDDMEPENNENQ